jgi:hypothetical protein
VATRPREWRAACMRIMHDRPVMTITAWIIIAAAAIVVI